MALSSLTYNFCNTLPCLVHGCKTAVGKKIIYNVLPALSYNVKSLTCKYYNAPPLLIHSCKTIVVKGIVYNVVPTLCYNVGTLKFNLQVLQCNAMFGSCL